MVSGEFLLPTACGRRYRGTLKKGLDDTAHDYLSSRRWVCWRRLPGEHPLLFPSVGNLLPTHSLRLTTAGLPGFPNSQVGPRDPLLTQCPDSIRALVMCQTASESLIKL